VLQVRLEHAKVALEHESTLVQDGDAIGVRVEQRLVEGDLAPVHGGKADAAEILLCAR
jgi:hypothetical protein